MADETKDPAIKSQSNIPTSKVERATKFLKTGAKVGANYLKHYAQKVVNPELSKDSLDKANAEDIYGALSELKGSALKVAQMMSMDKNILPQAYTDKFTMAQYSAPPLSYPLVVKTFQTYFGKSPTEIFDSFTKEAVNAASIGQVHQAVKGDKKFAVKVQYPGVAESISSDLKMVKPFAKQILGLQEKDLQMYMGEVEQMLVDETDYELELERGVEISTACAHIPNIDFPKYYSEYSSKRILTMDWLTGKHLNEFLVSNPSQEVRNRIGQALWDFYDFQMHELLAVHADPHPGNFLMREDGTVGIIDFGCVKVIPLDYYRVHFKVINPQIIEDDEMMIRAFYELGFIYNDDTVADKELFTNIFKDMIRLTVSPFRTATFDFGNDEYFKMLYEFGEKLAKTPELKNSTKPRGSKEALYLNRTYFGLYSMLNQLKAEIRTHTSWKAR
jgi:predicted unusual protein kinase regulating ubiquinone biosynthesis (AarF/ABC1/UbiB family)